MEAQYRNIEVNGGIWRLNGGAWRQMGGELRLNGLNEKRSINLKKM
jgi:hypothetical protein